MIDDISVLGQLDKLKILYLWCIKNLSNCDCLANCASLETFELHHSPLVTDFKFSSHLENLKTFAVSGNPLSLPSWDFLENLRQLEKASFCNCNIVDKDLLHLMKCEKLKSLELDRCSTIQNLSSLMYLYRLNKLALLVLVEVHDFSPIKYCKDLKDLQITGSPHLNNLSFLSSCEGLLTLNLSGCDEIVNIDEVKKCKKLQVLDLGGCYNFNKDWSFLDICTQLTYITLNCIEMEDEDWNFLRKYKQLNLKAYWRDFDDI